MLTLAQNCQGFVAAEGRYALQQDIFLDHVPSHPVIPTYVSSVSVKYKDYMNTSTEVSQSGTTEPDIHDTIEALILEPLDDKDTKGTQRKDNDEGTGGHLAGNFHGNLVDLPLYSDDTMSSEYRTHKGGGSSGGSGSGPGLMSPGPPQVMTPGPPPLKDSTRNSKEFNHPSGTKSLGRAATFPLLHDISEANQSISSYATIGPSLAASVGFASLFSGKRKKNNMAKTNSTFVAKITTNENLAKILANRVNEDVYVFGTRAGPSLGANLGRGQICDHLDVIIGFSTGDIIWFNPLSNKYCRLNKQQHLECKAIIKDSAVTMIRWLPGSESQFMASFQDGTIVVMDKDREDNTFSASTPPHENSFHTTRPKNGKHNPISHWHICRKPVTAFAFSPDLQHAAVVAMDGGLRIIDFRDEQLIETFQSYFGALNCVCWSPDGRYILTGGQDDLVTIWSFKDMKIVARCQGHQSYVTGVAFDPWRCDERNYRFGSVGEDAKLLLWDFSVGALHKPKAATTHRSGNNSTTQGTGGAFKPGHRSKNSIASLRDHPHHPYTKSPRSQETPSTLEAQELNKRSSGGARLAQLTLASDPSVARNSDSHHEGVSAKESPLAKESETNDEQKQQQQPTAMSDDPDSSNSTHLVDDKRERAPKKLTLQQSRGLPDLHLYQPQLQPQPQPGTDNSGRVHSEQQGHALFQPPRPLQQQQHDVNSPQESLMMRPPEPRSRVAMLQPALSVAIHQEPLASITFREDAIMTSDRRGHIKVWKRPPSANATTS
ncbi:hypothetical protein BGX31_006427 [Mortierella sp. GBA43]|nr:hypothetical protein BGX31_006427 [Mortierella sp. GBA43]